MRLLGMEPTSSTRVASVVYHRAISQQHPTWLRLWNCDENEENTDIYVENTDTYMYSESGTGWESTTASTKNLCVFVMNIQHYVRS